MKKNNLKVVRIDKNKNLISEIDSSVANKMLKSGEILGGMLVKSKSYSFVPKCFAKSLALTTLLFFLSFFFD